MSAAAGGSWEAACAHWKVNTECLSGEANIDKIIANTEKMKETFQPA